MASSTPSLAKYPVAISTAKANIRSKEYALYNPESGKFLVSSPYMEPVPIASTTKLMTAYLAAKHLDMDGEIVIGEEAAEITGSTMNLFKGDRLKARDLLYGAMIVSGNDAALTLGAEVGGMLLSMPNASFEAKVERFVQEMNATAASFSMADTRYMDPVGLNDEGRSTARDIAKLTAKVNEIPVIRAAMSTSEIAIAEKTGKRAYELKNSNRLTSEYAYPGNIGGKTGFTLGAGHCLVSSATRDGVTLIAVILNTNWSAPNASAIVARDLLDYGFSNFSWK